MRDKGRCRFATYFLIAGKMPATRQERGQDGRDTVIA